MNGKVETFEPKTRFRLLPFDQIRVDTGRDYLVKGLLPRTGLAVAWGPPQSGKSFWAYDVAMHVALGWEYRDHRTQRCPVVYIAGEGQGGFKRRVEAFRMEKMIENAEPPPFHLLGEPLDLIGEHGTLIQDIRAQLGEDVPGLVVLDTLNRTLVGSESKDEDMTAYVRAADALRDAFGCCVLVIHHCGIDGTRPRGFTGLTAAADAQFGVSQTGDTRTVEVEKQKDGTIGERVAFKLRTVEVAIDDDGDDVTSCVVEPVNEPATPDTGPALTANQRTMLTILQEAGPAGLVWNEWSRQAKEAGIGRNREATRYDIRAALKRKRLVHQDQSERWHVTTL